MVSSLSLVPYAAGRVDQERATRHGSSLWGGRTGGHQLPDAGADENDQGKKKGQGKVRISTNKSWEFFLFHSFWEIFRLNKLKITLPTVRSKANELVTKLAASSKSKVWILWHKDVETDWTTAGALQMVPFGPVQEGRAWWVSDLLGIMAHLVRIKSFMLWFHSHEMAWVQHIVSPEAIGFLLHSLIMFDL